MAVLAAIARFGLELEDDNFSGLAVFLNGSQYARAFNGRFAGGDVITVSDKEHSVQLDGAAHVNFKALDIDGLALGDLKLLAACFNYRVNFGTSLAFL